MAYPSQCIAFQEKVGSSHSLNSIKEKKAGDTVQWVKHLSSRQLTEV